MAKAVKSQINFKVVYTLNIFLKILIYIAVAAAVFLVGFLLYKFIRFLASKNIRVPQTAVWIFKLLLLIAVLIVAGYFIYTGFQI